jgi:AAA domain, putative AbiEii toxin, Type IV TA system
MLQQLEIQNFYSIRDLQAIDLRAAAHAPAESDRLARLWPGASERVPRVVVLFGANAAGKSNVLKALSFIAWFIRNSFAMSPEKWLPYARFNDKVSRESPTRLAVHFVGPADLLRPTDPKGPRCRYAYELVLGGADGKSAQVLRESVHYWPRDAGRRIRLLERDEQGAVAASKSFGLSGYRSALEKILRPTASVVATLAQLQHPLATLLYQLAGSIHTNLLIEKMELQEDVIARHYATQPQQLEELNRDIQRFDLGVKRIVVQSGANGPFLSYDHRGLGGPLLSQVESHGTRSFVKIFPLLHQALEQGGVAVVDELDLAIHPLVLPELLRWFNDPKRNPLNAQLWMTCNNASLLEELAKEEILFCEKDDDGRTTVFGLRDVQSVRRNDNYYRKYLAGAYGAVPRVG